MVSYASGFYLRAIAGTFIPFNSTQFYAIPNKFTQFYAISNKFTLFYAIPSKFTQHKCDLKLYRDLEKYKRIILIF